MGEILFDNYLYWGSWRFGIGTPAVTSIRQRSGSANQIHGSLVTDGSKAVGNYMVNRSQANPAASFTWSLSWAMSSNA